MSATHRAHFVPVSRELPSKRYPASVRTPLATAWKRLREMLRPHAGAESIESLASFMPVRKFNESPRFDFAVYSVHDGVDQAVLKVSCYRRSDAERLFEVYRTTGATSVTYFLVNWPDRRVLKLFRRDAVSH